MLSIPEIISRFHFLRFPAGHTYQGLERIVGNIQSRAIRGIRKFKKKTVKSKVDLCCNIAKHFAILSKRKRGFLQCQ